MGPSKDGDWSWLILVLALFGVAAVPGVARNQTCAPEGGGAVASASAPATTGPQTPRDTAFALLCAAGGMPPRGTAWASSGPGSCQPPDDAVRSLRALIVTVPDPERTRLGLYFDQTVDAVMAAAARSGFLLDRFSLPWRSRTHAPAADGPGGPGFLVFRRSESEISPPGSGISQPELLLVALVGESPVSGVDRSSLAVAIDVANRVLPPPAAAARRATTPRQVSGSLLVLGPFFSGTAPSLAQGLRGQPRPVQVITGSASNAGLAEIFGPGVVTQFSRTVSTDADLRAMVLDEIHRHKPDGRVAVLAESDTGYGDAFQGSVETTAGLAFTVFRFPLHVGQVRVAREKQQPSGSSRSPANLHGALELDLGGGPGEAPDTPPQLSALSRIDTDLVMRKTLSAIAHEGFDYLLIAATDVTDALFLAREARRQCPGVQLLTFGADQLLTHPDLRMDLSGMLVATTYPLSQAGLPLPSGVRGKHRQGFASETAEGVYNAAIALLAESGATRRTFLRDYVLPGTGKKGPGLWLTMVANGSFHPLAARVSPAPDNYRTDAPDSPVCDGGDCRQPASPTRFAHAVAALFLLAALAHLGLWLWARRLVPSAGLPRQARRRRCDPRLVSLFVPAQLRLRAGQALCEAALFLALGLTGAVFVAIALLFHQRDWPWSSSLWIWVPVTLGLLLVTRSAALDSWRAFRRTPRPQAVPWPAAREAPVLALMLLLMSVLAVAVGGWIVHLARLDDTARVLTLGRLADPFGLSPPLPLAYLAMGLYLWALCGLRSVRLSDRFPVLSPLPPSASDSVGLRRLLQPLHDLHDEEAWAFEVGVVVLFAAPGVYFWRHMLPTFEGGAYDRLFKASFLILYGAVVFAFAHFLNLSQRLLTALRRLARHPMAAAYERISVKVAGSFGLRFLSRVPQVEELEISAQVGRALAGLALAARRDDPTGAIAADAARLSGAADLMQRALEQIDGRPPAPPCPARRERRGHVAFFRASRLAFSTLSRVWDQRGRGLEASDLGKDRNLIGALEPGGGRQAVPTAAALWSAGVSGNTFLWTRAAEDFVAGRLTTLVHQVLAQLRELMVFALAGGLLLVVAVMSYPFHPPRFFTVLSWAMVLAVVAGGLLVIVRLERDEILSRLAGTTPGRVSFRMNFISQLVLYVLLPLTALVATLVPEAGDALFGWLEPIRKAFP